MYGKIFSVAHFIAIRSSFFLHIRSKAPDSVVLCKKCVYFHLKVHSSDLVSRFSKVDGHCNGHNGLNQYSSGDVPRLLWVQL